MTSWPINIFHVILPWRLFMNKIKPAFVVGLSLVFLFSSLPIFSQSHRARAWNLISQAATQGPPAGLSKLISTNASYGARGCAVKVGFKNPAEAANILIAIAQRLMIYANTTRQTRANENPKDPYQPFRYKYWQEAINQLSLADRYIKKLAKTNPLQAANMAIRIATLYYNNMPVRSSYKVYRDTYRAQARTHLDSSNPVSARSHAGKIKNKAQCRAMLNRIKAQRRAWNL